MGPPFRDCLSGGLRGQLAQHVMQDAAVHEVFDFVGGIDAAQRRRRSTFITCAICGITLAPEEVWEFDHCIDCQGSSRTRAVVDEDRDVEPCDEG